MLRPTAPPRVALYARVSTDAQAGAGAIASQVEALHRRAAADGFIIAQDLCFVDDGCSGSTLARPQLERLRDQAGAGLVDRLYVLSPDRLARHFAYQFLLLRELEAAGVEAVFLDHEPGKSPESDLLLQIQGAVAEYERNKIIDRTRRGKRHAARQGRFSVPSAAPYGYRYVPRTQGGPCYEVVLPQAAVMRQAFAWVGLERLSLGEVCRRLNERGAPTASGRGRWPPTSLTHMLGNPAYKGEAAYGKSRVVERRPPLRPRRGQPAVPRRGESRTREGAEPIAIPVPALVSAELFEQVAEQLRENRKRLRCRREKARHLLQGLLLCGRCGYALHGQRRADGKGRTRKEYVYYYCGGRNHEAEGGGKLCSALGARAGELDEAVWADVCGLLREPGRVEEEYRRRLSGPDDAHTDSYSKQIAAARKVVGRLIDAYGEGLPEKEELGPRLEQARGRLARLEAAAQAQAQAEAQQAELRLALGKLQEFAEEIEGGLEQADWQTRRDVIRAVVKEIVVGEQDVRIVYRVPHSPFVDRPNGGRFQDCRSRAQRRRSPAAIDTGQWRAAWEAKRAPNFSACRASSGSVQKTK